MEPINSSLPGNGSVKNNVADLKIFGRNFGVVKLFDRLGFTALGKAIKNYKKDPKDAQILTELEKNLILRAIKMVNAYKIEEGADLLVKIASVNDVKNKEMLIAALSNIINSLGYRQSSRKYALKEAKAKLKNNKFENNGKGNAKTNEQEYSAKSWD